MLRVPRHRVSPAANPEHQLALLLNLDRLCGARDISVRAQHAKSLGQICNKDEGQSCLATDDDDNDGFAMAGNDWTDG